MLASGVVTFGDVFVAFWGELLGGAPDNSKVELKVASKRAKVSGSDLMFFLCYPSVLQFKESASNSVCFFTELRI